MSTKTRFEEEAKGNSEMAYSSTQVHLTNRMWFSEVCTCTLIDHGTRHRSGQNALDSRRAPQLTNFDHSDDAYRER